MRDACLPAQLTSFVGRAAELERLAERAGARLLTLFGPPGIGKSRLGLRHAELASSPEPEAQLERLALAACSAFRGSFTLAAAEAVIDLLPEAPPVAATIAALRRKSLVRAFEPVELPGHRRLGLYESVRAYAAERLAASGRRDEVLGRHARHYVRLAAATLDPGAANATECDRAMILDLPDLRAAHARSTPCSSP